MSPRRTPPKDPQEALDRARELLELSQKQTGSYPDKATNYARLAHGWANVAATQLAINAHNAQQDTR